MPPILRFQHRAGHAAMESEPPRVGQAESRGFRVYLGASPSKQSVQRLKGKVGEILVPGNQAPWTEVRDRLNSLLRGWCSYFSYGSRQLAYEAVDYHVHHSVRRFLVRRHKVPTHGTRRFSYRAISGEFGVLRLVPRRADAPPCASG